jgi:TolB-like protein/Tfp pilus assembly protein PilF
MPLAWSRLNPAGRSCCAPASLWNLVTGEGFRLSYLKSGVKLSALKGLALAQITPSGRRVRFGQFEMDEQAGELRKEGIKIRLQEQPLQILQILLEHPGKVVSREELRTRVWPSDTFVDFDHGINNAIKRLREALGDTAETPRYIETLPRRGYRFLVTPAATIAEASIAVLPFLSLSAEPENEIFADGMCEEIISALTQVKNLQVAARTSSFSFKGKNVDLRVIGEQLNVRTVLEGSVRKSGNRLRISAQLVNTADGYHLWSEMYDREMKDVFAIQEEIAKSITQRLEVTLDSAQQSLLRAGTNNLEAFKFYTQGRSLFFQRDPRVLRSIECCRKAVALDPKYALAWSALADAYNIVSFYGLARPESCLSQAREAARQAMALDPSLAEAHSSLAMSHLFHDWDRVSAETEFLRSLELNPRNSLARSWYGLYYLQWSAGRFEEGLAQATQAVRIDPLSAYARAVQAFTYVPIDIDKCLETARETLQMEPDFYLGRWAQFTALNLQGRFAEAAEAGEAAIKGLGRSVWMLASLARTYARLGKRAVSQALYMELRWRSKQDYVSPAILAWAACAAGEQDEAIQFAQEADAIGDPSLTAAKYWPDFAELRNDPRFAQILINRGWK